MGKKTVDCLLIGHNEMDFREYEENVRKMGLHSGAYRDLELNFLHYNRTPYTAAELFNLFYCESAERRPSGSGALNSPVHSGETFNLAIAYLGTYLHRRGYTFDYIQSFQQEKEALAEKLARQEILTIAILTTLYVSVLPVCDILRFIDSRGTTAKIVIGGPLISNQVRTLEAAELEYAFKTMGADFYVNSSQGEATLVKLIHSLKNGLPVAGVENLYYKSGGGYTATPALREENPLAENMVDWGLFSGKAGTYVNLRTSISCPFSCSFCGFPQHAGAYQTAGVEVIREELRGLAKLESVRCVQFIDDTFNVPVKRFKSLLRMIIENRFPFRWHSHFRCQYADRETVALMKESGCEGVFLGIESGSRPILENMNKQADLEKYRQGIALLKEYGILTYGSFIIGFPGETGETVRETMDFIEASGLDFFRAQLWYCDTITPIWQEREKYRIRGSNFEWSHATMDSKKAADWVDHIFFSIDSPLWVPQYHFEFDGIFHLLHRGLALDRVKGFLRTFRNALRAKLKNPAQREADFHQVEEIRKHCQPDPLATGSKAEGDDMLGQYGEGFDF